MSTLSVKMNELRNEGYLLDFTIRENNLINERSQELVDMDAIVIDKHFRFEGISNPSDNSILYAISLNHKEKGILIDAYGADSTITKALIKLVR